MEDRHFLKKAKDNKPGIPARKGASSGRGESFGVRIEPPARFGGCFAASHIKDSLLLLKTKIGPVVRAHLRDNGRIRIFRQAPQLSKGRYERLFFKHRPKIKK
jgi:hypothetical protein